jgi:GNAT superfamily N-acetyltransferase
VSIRPLRTGDETRLQDFFRSHTPETIQERYGYPVTEMSAERAAELVNVDQTRDCALGVFSRDGRQLHAVGRYCLDRGGDAAEVAFVVRESMRGRGLATGLLRWLIAVARARGLSRLWAQANAHNATMLGILRRHGFMIKPDPETGLSTGTLKLPPIGQTPLYHDHRSI